ncbi:hypothetical protein [Spiroplasma culicicola]|uniref:Uncharacterized protein n=1 Tax=Spiroplasma culicicola AES-1 TaxID=1276246 RepID=W6A6Y1_9MOLU|nr:hypothetical protein [Spiroplasma culicicola]AHI52726.1 hypothetical protein SCULI_v1c03850 [Spiroplasma culicicola AES-1]
MCCNCNYNYVKNCTCLIYEKKCIDFICCWCCVFQRWISTQIEGSLYKNLIADIQNAINNNKELKILKKVLKNQFRDIDKIQKDFDKYLANDYLTLIDGEQAIEQVVPEIELQLGQKIRLQLTEWEVYFEVCRVVLEMDNSYFTKMTYLNMFEMTEVISKTLYEFAQLFLKTIRTQENVSFIETTKEKFVDLEKIVEDFQRLLTNKIANL